MFGAGVPHEVAGFTSGAKYFFPGVAGPELTHTTHWLGALAGIENIIGKIETPTRHLIEAGAELLTPKIILLNTAVSRQQDGRLRSFALFAGDIQEAFRRAAEVSSQVHIRYTGRKYARVIALLDLITCGLAESELQTECRIHQSNVIPANGPLCTTRPYSCSDGSNPSKSELGEGLL